MKCLHTGRRSSYETTFDELLCLMLAGLGYLIGAVTGSEAGSVVVIAFVSFMLPVAAGWLVMKIDALNEMLWDVVRS